MPTGSHEHIATTKGIARPSQADEFADTPSTLGRLSLVKLTRAELQNGQQTPRAVNSATTVSRDSARVIISRLTLPAEFVDSYGGVQYVYELPSGKSSTDSISREDFYNMLWVKVPEQERARIMALNKLAAATELMAMGIDFNSFRTGFDILKAVINNTVEQGKTFSLTEIICAQDALKAYYLLNQLDNAQYGQFRDNKLNELT